jgi:hypothetical protein
LRITRFPALSEAQFLGCAAAFSDSFTGELNAAASALRRLEERAKGSSFAHEMELDRHRYGALIVLDRWSTVIGAFGPHLTLSRRPDLPVTAGRRIQAAEQILIRANELVDAADRYTSELVETCAMAWRSAAAGFAEERSEAEYAANLGPMLPEEYTSARRIFLEDLAAR